MDMREFIKKQFPDIPILKHMPNGPVKDLTYYITTPTWSLKEGLNLLATFRAEELYPDALENKDEILENCWMDIEGVLYRTLEAYELEEETFLKSANVGYNPDDNKQFDIVFEETEIYPDSFINWAKDMSLPVPEDFYQKLMRAQERHSLGRKSKESQASALSASEKRELGRLRREKENFDLAIKATVRAVQFCINAGRRVKREELFDLLTSGKDAISKEMYERILPLLPPEYRKGAGAPSKCKIGDPSDCGT